MGRISMTGKSLSRDVDVEVVDDCRQREEVR